MSNCLLCEGEVEVTFGWQELLGLKEEKLICHSCEGEMLKIEGDICRKCGRVWSKVPAEHRQADCCTDCHKWEQIEEFQGLLHMNRSLFQYNDFMKDVLARYKFRGDAVLASLFKEAMQNAYAEFYQKDDPTVVPIPLSELRLYERGFNQSRLLAEQLPADMVEALSKTESEKQSKKARTERLTRENTFYVPDPEKVSEKKILLIDDIYTTGTTIRMAAKKLKDAGAKEISALTLVRS